MSFHLIRFLRIGLPALAAFACFLPYRRRALDAQKLHSGLLREVALHLFVLYLFGLAAMILWPPYHWENQSGLWGDLVLHTARESRFSQVNLIPFRTITMFLRMLLDGERFDPTVNLLGNILLFLPLGFFPALLFRQVGWCKILLIGFGYSGGCEAVQYFIGRNCDVDDLMLNVLGVILGFWLYRILAHHFPKAGSAFHCRKK